MKHIITCQLLLIFIPLLTFGQDQLVTIGGDTIHCKIRNIELKNIYYTISSGDSIKNKSISVNNIVSWKSADDSTFLDPNYDIIKNYKSFRFAFGGGYAHLTGKTAPSLSTEQKQYIKEIKSGYSLFFEVAGFFSPTYGIGGRYDVFRSKYNGYVNNYSVIDNIYATFIAPGFYSRLNLKTSNAVFFANYHLGYFGYKNNSKINSNDVTISGKNIGLSVDIGFDFPISKNVAINTRAAFFVSSLSKMTYKSGYNSETKELEEPENMSRLELTLGLSFGN